jgi:hypothetical protein
MNTKACYRELTSYKYQLVKKFRYQTGILGFDIDLEYIKLDSNGNLTVLKNYAWDGASGPTINTLNSMRASLVHDVLYQLLRMKELTQDQVIVSDKLFRKILIKDGMNSFRAWYWYKGLRLANGKAAKPGTQKPPEITCTP